MKILLLAGVFMIGMLGRAQTTYLPLNDENYHLLDRLETRSGRLSDELFLTTKPVSRKNEVRFLDSMETDKMTAIDQYNVRNAISESGEWAADENGAIDSKHPVLKTFYKKQADLVWVHMPNFFLSVNPVIAVQGTHEQGNPENILLQNRRGVEMRGWVSKKVGFYFNFSDNQERIPSVYDSFVKHYQAVPGVDYYQEPKPYKYDYILASGYIDFAAVKDHINVTAGYDKHFIGDGIRSMFLSNFDWGDVRKADNAHMESELPESVHGANTAIYPRGGQAIATQVCGDAPPERECDEVAERRAF